jgi:mxaJ protein
MPSAFLRLAVALAITGTSAAARELRVCADPNNLPFSDERREGFENRIVEIVAQELGASVSYTWWAQRRGFLRNTLNARRCDLVAGIPAGMETLRTTAPYYRSGYVFVSRLADRLDIDSFDDPRLAGLRVGVQLVGDDGANTPPAHALARRGIVGALRGYSVYGDYARPNPAARIVHAVAAGEVDVAIVWGPFAGYFAGLEPEPLHIERPATDEDGAALPLAFDIAMGVRKDDAVLAGEVDAALARRRADIDAVLAAYGVPRLDARQAEPR